MQELAALGRAAHPADVLGAEPGCSVDHMSMARRIGTPMALSRVHTPSSSTMSGSPGTVRSQSVICETRLASGIFDSL